MAMWPASFRRHLGAAPVDRLGPAPGPTACAVQQYRVDEGTMKSPALNTRRLLLRRWTEDDLVPLAAINSDPEVMRYRSAPLSRQESDHLVDEIETCFDNNGFGLWAVERRHDGRLLGFTGLAVSDFDAPFCPAVDIGWTFARNAWGHGYATEAATASLAYAFAELRLPEVVAHTTSLNEPSRAVMRRLGMTHDPADDFDGPWYPAGHPRRRFVLYRINEPEWKLQQSGRAAQ
jgi:RimJ/RimL family protein N-acetyltransferase